LRERLQRPLPAGRGRPDRGRDRHLHVRRPGVADPGARPGRPGRPVRADAAEGLSRVMAETDRLTFTASRFKLGMIAVLCFLVMLVGLWVIGESDDPIMI